MNPNTDPVFTSRLLANTATGTTAAMYIQDGPTDGAATGALTLATTSTVDALNSGVLLELLASESASSDASGGASEPKYPAISQYHPSLVERRLPRQRPYQQV
jgi:hypothetical protein